MRPTVQFKDLSLTESAILYQTDTQSNHHQAQDYDPEEQDQYDSDYLLNHPSLKFSSPLTRSDHSTSTSASRTKSSSSSNHTSEEEEEDSQLSDSDPDTSTSSSKDKDSPPLPSSDSSTPKHLRFPKLLQSRFQSYQSSRQREKGRKRAQLKEMVHNNLGSHFRSWFKETSKDGTPILPHQLSKKYTVSDKILGQGSFAVVKTLVEKSSGIERALKIIAKKPLKDGDKEGNMLKEEINILGKVENKNIIKMHDLYETKEGVFIVTDLCKGGELFDRLVEKVHFNELDARHIMRQVFEGVEYLHQHDIIHRDLKPENILLRDKEGEEIVISDFGLSKFIPDDGLLMTACGSPQYVSPEVLLGKGYGPSVDIWSSGVIAYCLLGGYTPFYGEDQPSLFQQILSMKVQFEPEYWSEISDLAKDFIVKCLCSAEVRMTASEALDHPWLSLSNLPPADSKEVEQRGACLKSGAKRNLELSAKQRLTKAVTAVEAVNYLQKLHSLRMDHHEPSSERLNSLQKIVTTIRNHKRGDSLLPSPTSSNKAELDHDIYEREIEKSDSANTVMTAEPEGEDSNQKLTPKMNQGMNLDLIIMPVFMPDQSGIGLPSSTSSDSNSTQRPSGRNEDQEKKSSSNANQFDGTQALASAVGAVSPTDNNNNCSTDSDDVNTPRRQASPVSSETTEKPSESQIPGGSSRAQQLRQENTSAGRGPSSSSSKASASSTKTLNTLLDQYKSTELPSSARLDPTVEQRVPAKMTLTNAWKYVPFLLNQGVSIGSAVASHAFYGPLKKSWGMEMSVFTRILRDAASYTEFASIAGLQQFFEMSTLLPTPKDGLITPVTFKVKKRNLRGFLKESDEMEDGNRELTGEWVVGKNTWRRLQSEWRNGKRKGKERVILYIHGGAYFIMSAATHRPLTIALSKYTECRVFGINYRLAPDTKFPGALHDCVSAYFRLTDDLGIPPNNIVLGADSAGGGLALALMYYLRDNNYDLPSGAMLFSPWVDLTLSCDSWETNAKFDYLPIPRAGDHMNPVYAYLGENLSKYLTHPYVSPLFGDMKGLPPLLIQCGDAELLRDEVTLLAHKASLAGVAVRHELYEDCVHVFQAFLFLDASRKALQSARHFVRTALDKRGSRISKANSRNASKASSAVGDSNDVGTDLSDMSLVDDATRDRMDKEMKSKDMINSKGEKVEFRTGEKLNLNPRDGKERAESDNELEDGDEIDNRDEEQWELSDAESSSQMNNDKAKQAFPSTTSSTSSSSSSSQDMRRSSTQPSHSSESSSSQSKSRRTISGSLTTTSLEEARARATAGMRAQHSGHGAHLSKFHPPSKSNSYRPKIRSRAGSQSNPNLEDLMQSYQNDHTSLHTQVWTPDS